MLIRMSRADGRHHVNEDKMIREIARRMNISEEELDEIRERPLSVKFTLPETEDERLVVLYHLLFIMRIDQNISPEEKDLCREMGFRLGLNPLMVQDMIDVMADHLDQKLPDELLLATIKRYRN